MLLGTKRLTFLGVLLALAIVLNLLSGIIESSTLFFLAAASFCVGIAIYECGWRFGLAFYLAAAALSLFILPNKFYVLTFCGISLYLILIERIRSILAKKQIRSIAPLWCCKYILFNLIYLPTLLFFPKLIYAGDISTGFFMLLLAGGQIAFLFYDLAYDYVVVRFWKKYRRMLIK